MLGADAAGDGEHRLVQVDADDRAVGRDPVGGGAGDDAGAAGDVEHTAGRAPTPAASQRIGAHWAKKAGTNAAS